MDYPLILNKSRINFCVYGLGLTGMSVIKFFNKKNFNEYKVWDDNKVLKSLHTHKRGKKKEEKIFSKQLDASNYIVVSPGVSLKKAKLKKKTYRK